MSTTRTLAFLLLAFLLAGALPAVEIRTIDSETPLKGEIQDLDERQRLLVKLDGSDEKADPQPVALDGIEIVDYARKVVLPQAADAPLRIVMKDGSEFTGSVKPLAEGDVASDLFSFIASGVGTLKLEATNVARLEVRANVEADTDRVPGKDEAGDYFWRLSLTNGDALLCDIDSISTEGLLPWREGFDFASPFAWSRIRSFVQRLDRFEELSSLFGMFQLTNGAVIKGRISRWGKGKVALSNPLFGDLDFKEDQISSVALKNGRFVYLSDMQPEKVEEYPYIRDENFDQKDHLFPWQRDRAQGGGAIRMAGRRYAKGLGVHAISKLTFRSDRRYTRFVADIGIDDSATDLASVEFTLLVDGKEVPFTLYRTVTTTNDKGESVTKEEKSEVTTTGTVRKSHGAMRVELSIAGATSVELVVKAADNGDISDRANWANAKFVR